MANVDRATLKSRQQNLTDRTGEFSAAPLIQKEDQQSVYGDDFMDSALVKLPNVGSINGPSAAFNVDFDFSQGIDRYDIDTTGSVESTFTITLQGLSDNQTGILNITKKSQDTFTFANGLMTPFNNTEGQNGQTTIVMFVKIIASTYIVQIGYNAVADTVNIKDRSITKDKLNYNATFVNQTTLSILKFKRVEIGSWNMSTSANKGVNTGIDDLAEKVLFIDVYINDDFVSNLEPLLQPVGGTTWSDGSISGCVDSIVSNTINLKRSENGRFEGNSLYDNTSINRGYISILYFE